MTSSSDDQPGSTSWPDIHRFESAPASTVGHQTENNFKNNRLFVCGSSPPPLTITYGCSLTHHVFVLCPLLGGYSGRIWYIQSTDRCAREQLILCVRRTYYCAFSRIYGTMVVPGSLYVVHALLHLIFLGHSAPPPPLVRSSTIYYLLVTCLLNNNELNFPSTKLDLLHNNRVCFLPPTETS